MKIVLHVLSSKAQSFCFTMMNERSAFGTSFCTYYFFWKLLQYTNMPSFFKKLFQWSSQTVTEHRTASTDRRCEYLNGYVTVQHRSFGKPSFLDPRSSLLETETQSLHLETRSSHLKTRSVRASRREDRVSSFEHRVSTYFWAVL